MFDGIWERFSNPLTGLERALIKGDCGRCTPLFDAAICDRKKDAQRKGALIKILLLSSILQTASILVENNIETGTVNTNCQTYEIGITQYLCRTSERLNSLAGQISGLDQQKMQSRIAIGSFLAAIILFLRMRRDERASRAIQEAARFLDHK